MQEEVRQLIEELRHAVTRPWAVMEVCGCLLYTSTGEASSAEPGNLSVSAPIGRIAP